MNLELDPKITSWYDLNALQNLFVSILAILCSKWRFIIFCALTGLLVSYGNWFFFGKYRASTQIQNQWGEIISPRILDAEWSSVATKILETAPGLSNEDISFYKTISSIGWWRDSVNANYAFTKSDLKDVPVTPEQKRMLITSLSVNWTDASPVKAETQLQRVSKFMVTASAYHQVITILDRYELELRASTGKIENVIYEKSIDLNNLNGRLGNLEELYKRFPGGSTGAKNLTLVNENASKYFPLDTQIIATKREVYSTQTEIEKLRQDLIKYEFLSDFLSQARTLAKNDFNGVSLVAELLSLQNQLRVKVSPTDFNKLSLLARIRSDLDIVAIQFNAEKVDNINPSLSRASRSILPSIIGLILGIIVGCLASLTPVFLRTFKKVVA